MFLMLMNFRFPRTGNLLSYLCTDVVTSLFKVIISVSKNFGGLISIAH